MELNPQHVIKDFIHRIQGHEVNPHPEMFASPTAVVFSGEPFPSPATLPPGSHLGRFIDAQKHTAEYDRARTELLLQRRSLEGFVVVARNPFVIPAALRATGKITGEDEKKLFNHLVNGLENVRFLRSSSDTIVVSSKDNDHDLRLTTLSHALNSYEVELAGRNGNHIWAAGNSDDLDSLISWLKNSNNNALRLQLGIPLYTDDMRYAAEEEMNEIPVFDNDAVIVTGAGSVLDLSRGLRRTMIQALTEPIDADKERNLLEKLGIKKTVAATDLPSPSLDTKTMVTGGVLGAIGGAVIGGILYKRRKRNE